MRSKLMIWFAVILGATFVLLLVGKCGYDKLGDLTTLEGKSVSIEEEFPDVKHITTGSLAKLIRSSGNDSPLLLIDARGADEFEVSHIEGALNFETATAIQEHLAKVRFASAPTIAVYCSVGQRSAVLVDELQKSGVEEVMNVRGSIFAWANEDRPLVNSKNEVTEKVHPFNEFWGRLLTEDKRFDLDQ